MATPEPNPTVPKAFISYSWDDDAHKEWVKQLATHLRADGVDVTLDRWHSAPGDQIPEFMERAVRENDFVIAVCTPQFKERSDGRGGGVGYEGDIMTAYAFTGGDKNKKKFIPVLRRGNWSEVAPSWLIGRAKIDLSGDPYSKSEYEDLLQTLLGAREKAPPVGPRRDFRDEKCLDGSPAPAPAIPLVEPSTPQHQSSATPLRNPAVTKEKQEEGEKRVFQRVFKYLPGLPSLDDCACCQNPTSPCEFRRDALLLTAELISVNEMYQRHLEVQDLLRRISFHSTILLELARVDTRRKKEPWRDYRQKYLLCLKNDFSEVSEFLDVLGSNSDHWEKFLAARIVHHIQHKSSPVARPPIIATSRFRRAEEVFVFMKFDPAWEYEDMVNHVINDVLKHYFQWAEDLHKYISGDRALTSQQKSAYERYLDGGTAGLQSPSDKDDLEFWFKDMEKLSNFAKAVSDALSGWALYFFSECHQRIVQAMKETGPLDSILGKFVEALPHSERNSCPYERTWVDEED